MARYKTTATRLWRIASILAIVFVLLHFWDGLRYWWVTSTTAADPESVDPRLTIDPEDWTHSQATAYTDVFLLLEADGIDRADEWARAIVEYTPTLDRGYLALLLAQIRRESHFNAPDIEWLFDRVVPEALHDFGVEDPVSTIGPMQIKQHHLRRVTGIEDRAELKRSMSDIQQGVFAAVCYIDLLITDYYPDRDLRGWATMTGRIGFSVIDQQNYAPNWDEQEMQERMYFAAIQKMLSDLTGDPLVLDGDIGSKTHEAARRFSSMLPPDEQAAFNDAFRYKLTTPAGTELADSVPYQVIKDEWTAIYGQGQDRIFPRIAHDPRICFIFADFNVGRHASRLAALQWMAGQLTGRATTADGLYGQESKTTLLELIQLLDLSDEKRAEWQELIPNPEGKRDWVVLKLHELTSSHWERKHETPAPMALIPSISTHRFSHDVKGIGPMTVRQYVVGSTTFYEDYYARLIKRTTSLKPIGF